MTARFRDRRITAVLVASLLVGSLGVNSALAGAGSGSATSADGATNVVRGETFQPGSIAGAASTARAADRRLTPRGVHPAGASIQAGPAIDGTRISAGVGAQGAGADGGTQSVAGGISVLHTQAPLQWFDSTGGVIGNKVLYGNLGVIRADPHLPTGQGIAGWDPGDFFNLPGNEYYFGATVSASISQGRWVAAMPSHKADCSTGYMNVAVSTTTDPTKAWKRYRIPMGNAWADAVRIGVSDNKIVLATDRWDLDDSFDACLSSTYEGAKLRVADWADLLTGATLTSQDVSPPTSTSYYEFVPATNVATAGSTTTGTTLYLAGDRYASGTWGNVVFATITGSAKAGTAALARNENLTAAGEVSLLGPPPATIAAFSSGNGFQDERVVSTTYRNGRLWLSNAGSCTPAGDSAARACARYVLLDTTTTPATQIESAYFAEAGRDTFMPLVGFSRDGGAYFTMAASSALATEPIDQLATYRASGEPLVGGDAEVAILEGATVINDTYFGSTGSIMAVPNDARAALAVYPGEGDWTRQQDLWGSWTTQLRGAQTGDPGGSFFKVGTGTEWTRTRSFNVVLRPTSSSPIRTFRYSASPDTESTAGGPRLVDGLDVASISLLWDDFSDPLLGGTSDGPTVTVYGQWQTWDGTWSAPTSATLTIDDVNPVVTNLKFAFGSGKVGSTAPMKVTWNASDAESGLWFLQYFEERSDQFFEDLPATATSYTRSLKIGTAQPYDVQITAVDNVDNGSTWDPTPISMVSVPSSPDITYTKTWSTSSNSNYLGGSTKYATASGATVSYEFTGRAIAFISTKSPNRGKAEIWIDGVKQTTIDLYSGKTKYRQIAYQASWANVGDHTIMVKVLGTNGRPRVDFDSFLRMS